MDVLSSFPVATKQSKTESHRDVERDETWSQRPSEPVCVPNAPSLRFASDDHRPMRFVPIHEAKMPAGEDEFHWTRENRIVLVKFYQVECISDPNLSPIRAWCTDPSEAIATFYRMHKVKPQFNGLLKVHVTELPPEESTDAA